MLDNLVFNSNAFGGKVYFVNKEYIHTVNFDDFTPTGKRSFLAACKIPYSFFNKQPEAIQKELIISAKAHISTTNIALLMIEDKIEYCSTVEDTITTIVDPFEMFPILAEVNASLRRRDFLSGIDRYQITLTDVEPNEYIPAGYVDIPILYAGKMTFEVGLYKGVCSNGLLDVVNSTKVALTQKQINPATIGTIISGVVNGLHSLDYSSFMNWLKASELNLPQAKQFVEELISNKTLTKTLSVAITKHLDFIQSDSLKALDGLPVPTAIKSKYDLLDVITYYCKSQPSVGMQKKVESAIFDLYYKEFRALTNNNIIGLDVKAFAPNQQQNLLAIASSISDESNTTDTSNIILEAEVITESEVVEENEVITEAEVVEESDDDIIVESSTISNDVQEVSTTPVKNKGGRKKKDLI